METKIKPNAVELEEAVLGALMLEAGSIVRVANILKPEMFYKETHQRIYSAVQDLYNNSRPIDILTVTEKLRSKNDLDFVGGAFAITELIERVSSAANIEYHAHIIQEKYRKRIGIQTAHELSQSLYDDSYDISDGIGLANELVLSLSNESSNVGGQTISDATVEMLREQENELRGEFSGCKTKFVDLDKIIVGMKNQQVAVLAARPGMGKTTLAINIAYRLAKYDNTPVGFFSLEMSSVELTKKFASIETQIQNSRITMLGDGELTEYFKRAGNISNLPIYIDDKPGSSIDEIRTRAITMKRKNNVKLIVIDYLQLITTKGKSGNREQEISEISRKIKLLAKELDIPIIAISQLSRQVEQSDPKVPFLHHLRESGSIEQDADMVLMLWRPEYYDYPEFQFDNDTIPSKNMCVCYVRKNRNGDTGKALFRNNLALSSFYDNTVENFMPFSSEF